MLQRIGMDGNKEVGVVVVGYVGTRLQAHKLVACPRVDHLDILVPIGDHLAQPFGDSQIDVLLVRFAPPGAGIASAMSSVDHHSECFLTRLQLWSTPQRAEDGDDKHAPQLVSNRSVYHHFVFCADCLNVHPSKKKKVDWQPYRLPPFVSISGGYCADRRGQK